MANSVFFLLSFISHFRSTLRRAANQSSGRAFDKSVWHIGELENTQADSRITSGCLVDASLRYLSGLYAALI